jgi:predicted ABC-type ATPase
MLQRIEELLKEDVTFAIETTLATRSYVNLVKRAQRQGYRVNLLYFWLSSPELAMRRVAERVSKGGHDIPEEIIRRRYTAGINNLFKLFMPAVDYWAIFDNSQADRLKIASGRLDKPADIKNRELYETIVAYVR